MLIAEYLAADALARLRAEATPSILGGVAISRGLEEHASFAWQAALQTRRALRHLRTVLALEWVVAERALRMGGVPARRARSRRCARWPPGFDQRLEDRPIGEDAELAEAALPELAAIVRDVSGEAFPASH